MFSRRFSTPVPPSPVDKKRRFSWLRPREIEVTTLPQANRSPSPTSATLHSTDLTSPFPPLLFFSHSSRPESVLSSESTSDDIASVARARAPSSLDQVLENARTSELETDADGPPTYSVTMASTTPVTYGFVRTSPFAMVVSPDGVQSAHGHGLYHIGVGVNVWMPNCTVTTIRRGPNENGPVVAEVELGISSVSATVTIGGITKNLQQVYFRKSSTSSSRLYFTGDGSTIKWKLGASSWQAHVGSTLLATFVPTPPRKLTLHPAGHAQADHIMISLVIIMREQLTPVAGIRGNSAELFNYSAHHSYQED
ncbi:hypothetical protein BDY19DRAFT_988951 [Irpex rosettiformis]|uniref:Uncharacterized protein n=1 Tax=Irpex rosettiformis TaxID=378272 RepID=A0ACB8ULU3_9APHY|nr:hypothetical protein BDY19DRAFT_988951 [Irpex rosettiformis]